MLEGTKSKKKLAETHLYNISNKNEDCTAMRSSTPSTKALRIGWREAEASLAKVGQLLSDGPDKEAAAQAQQDISKSKNQQKFKV